MRTGHPWIYRADIADLRGRWSAGEAVDVADAGGQFLGRGFYNPRPSLACRLLTRERETMGPAFFVGRLRAARDFRARAGLLADAYRLCWSEADGLPGLVVDRYGPVSVVQCLTLGMSRALSWITEALGHLFPAAPIYRVDDATAARIEGFEPERGWVTPPRETAAVAERLLITDGRCQFAVRLAGGHKTGFYLDQRDNRARVAEDARGRRMLDAFCYSGAFACHALRAGASSALLVDSSAEALAAARENLELNGVGARAELREANAFDVLRQLDAAAERFRLIVLDPPPFTRRKDALDSAARGYKEINLRAIRLLEPGGVLATFSCSHHVSPALFEEICRGAAGDAGQRVRVLAALTQSRDHPVLLNVPETRYLTGLLLERL